MLGIALASLICLSYSFNFTQYKDITNSSFIIFGNQFPYTDVSFYSYLGTTKRPAITAIDLSSDYSYIYPESISYSCQESIECKDTQQTAIISDSVSGRILTDRITIGSITFDKIPFIEITGSASERYINSSVIGLGRKGALDNDPLHFINYLKTNKVIINRIVGFCSRKYHSELSIGSYNTKLAKEKNIHWAKQEINGEWSTTIDKITFNTYTFNPGKVAITDGYNFTMPSEEYIKVMHTIKSYSYYCDDANNYCEIGSINKLPSLYLYIGNEKIKISYTYYIEVLSLTVTYCSDDGCSYDYNVSVLITKGSGWELGRALLRKFYVIFDYDNDRLGLRTLAEEKSTQAYRSTIIITSIVVGTFGLVGIFIIVMGLTRTRRLRLAFGVRHRLH